MSQLGDNIKKFRKANKLSQTELGEKIGLSRSAISLYETGKRKPTITGLQKLSSLFGVSMDQLAGKEFDPELFLNAAESDSDYSIE